MEFYLKKHEKDHDMLEIYTKGNKGKTWLWTVVHSDFFYDMGSLAGESADFLERLDEGPIKMKLTEA